jgi:RNA polymerase sigma-70 factor (ECF subfamily)
LIIQGYHINEVIEGCCAQNPQFQKILFKQFAPKMLGICMRYCKNDDSAKDAMQEGFIKIFKHISNFKAESKLETWMTRIMINCALTEWKKSNKWVLPSPVEDHDPLFDTLPDNSPDIISALEYRDLINMLQQLPDGYRVVFNMYVVEGYSHQEIAQELGISVGTSKSQLNRARKNLQLLLQKKTSLQNE